MAKYRDPHTGAVRESSTPMPPPYELVAEEATREELAQEAERRGIKATGSKAEIAKEIKSGGSTATVTTS